MKPQALKKDICLVPSVLLGVWGQLHITNIEDISLVGHYQILMLSYLGTLSIVLNIKASTLTECYLDTSDM